MMVRLRKICDGDEEVSPPINSTLKGVTGRLDSSIEFTDVSRWNPDGKGHRDEQVQRGAPHGRNITEVGHPRAPAEVLRGLIVQVEMDALNQDVGC